MHQSTTWKFTYANLAILLASLLWGVNAHASNWLYAEVDASSTRIDVDGTEFNPILPRLKLGLFITQQIMLEVQYTGSGDDTVANTKMEVENIRAAYLRLDSGIRGDIRMYVLLGNAMTSLKTSTPDGANRTKNKYSDFSWGVGLEDRVWSQHTLLTLEYTEYYSNNDVTISAVSLGFKVEY